MENSAYLGILAHNVKAVAVSLPVVYHDGKIELARHLHLRFKAIGLLLAVVGLPIVVKPDLAECDDLVLFPFFSVLKQSVELLKLALNTDIGACDVLGVNSRRYVHKRIFLSLLDRAKI